MVTALHVCPDRERLAGLKVVVDVKQPKRQSRLAAACRQVSFANSKLPGAGEGIRTLDPDLGKVVLYH